MKNRALIIVVSLLVAVVGCFAALKTAETVARFQIEHEK
jgi:NO-binding membrane sensor protein with MHYT domain